MGLLKHSKIRSLINLPYLISLSFTVYLCQISHYSLQTISFSEFFILIRIRLLLHPLILISYRTTKTLQNTVINQSSSYNNDEPELNNDQNITSSSDSFSTSCSNDSFFFETQHSYDNIIPIPNIDPYGIIEAFQNMFINQSPSSLSSLSSPSFSFIHDELESNNEQNITPFSNSFPTSCSNDFSSFKTQNSYNNVITTTNIDLYEIIETFQDMHAH
ncbi:hypothetical protein F8M41_022470 [Gigaspora margarita]|uniref:Uncharacterized protein n=1 Tax=Gigaspora margarita TaxID=4874 RepID=A0A8H4EI32_GIGMA|nr:hypothetical protein F8M41_022470 [Gigaspora margarita]